ncbi:hypothetical protein [Fusibacter bizertensis]|uniref:hypothetical protein n=1 Tax=Fusibacter bizertensis TaxID=1488331 RepID=UPI0024802ADB|nr:hypothetical protein [Fusibacter bizertensis]
MGEYDATSTLFLEESHFKIVFRLTDPSTQFYSISMDVIIDYSNEAILNKL